MSKPIAGIQMYSLRDEAERDILETLEKVAEMGYKAIESIGYFNAPPNQLKRRADELDLAIPSMLVSLNFKTLAKLGRDFARDIEIAAGIGVSYIIVPWVPMHEQPTMEDMHFLADVLIRCGEQTKAAGMKLALHNHDYEMKLVDGRPAFDRLLELVPEELMVAELDLGWIYMAGHDPVDYLKKHKARTPLVHIRDFKTGRKDTELGKGVVGVERLLQEIEKADVEYMFVEQEDFLTTSLDSAMANILYLKKLGYA
ncbi:sugar phosphate isomerase/epimerase [Paenibacillus sp. 1011MAR3C5]|uniref:sugar phosphate isomerase/epimerase family protein n=1 Tax=Paenibacillus sp. 1011MAR3C5 TaxID=1675787 RepID=UPI00160484EB|nr:sugar phosphate isomerase/epimerase [Paenibacillus sp. 1011MAR3C5]